MIGALFLLGLVLFNKPLLGIFDAGSETTLFGIPLLYVYLFAAWGLLIALMAWAVERRRRASDRLGGN